MEEETVIFKFEWNPPKMLKQVYSWIKNKIIKQIFFIFLFFLWGLNCMVNNPIIEKIDNTIYAIYEYQIAHVTQKKRRTMKDGSVKEYVITTNRATFPYDLYKLLEIEADDEGKEYIYFYLKDNKIYVSKDIPAVFDEMKKIRLNKRRGYVKDLVDPSISRRSKIVSLPKNVFVDSGDVIRYYLNTVDECVCVFVE